MASAARLAQNANSSELLEHRARHEQRVPEEHRPVPDVVEVGRRWRQEVVPRDVACHVLEQLKSNGQPVRGTSERLATDVGVHEFQSPPSTRALGVDRQGEAPVRERDVDRLNVQDVVEAHTGPDANKFPPAEEALVPLHVGPYHGRLHRGDDGHRVVRRLLVWLRST